MYIYIQFIVHLLTFSLVHQWVKLHYIYIEEQSKKTHERQAHVGISALYFKERRGGGGGQVSRNWGSWGLPVLKQAVWVNYSTVQTKHNITEATRGIWHSLNMGFEWIFDCFFSSWNTIRDLNVMLFYIKYYLPASHWLSFLYVCFKNKFAETWNS